MSFKFKRGDVVMAFGQIGIIRDVLASTQETGNECVYVSFVHNLGNSRQYDMLELTPENDRGTSEWRLATWSEFAEATQRKWSNIESTFSDFVTVSAKNFAGDGLPQ
jgi:hypothetical protein